MSKIYYKATRPDGTDFRTGTVRYEVGAQLPKIPKVRGVARECCTSTVYHASDSSSETLIGGRWPARLFEVTGKSVASEGHKHGFVTLKIEREIEAHEVFGPNGEAVVALIESAKTLTPEQAEQLHAARNAARNAAWYAAWYAARNAAEYAARNAAEYEAENAAGNAAGYAAGYAATALVVKDLIAPQQFETLSGPWFGVMGG